MGRPKGHYLQKGSMFSIRSRTQRFIYKGAKQGALPPSGFYYFRLQAQPMPRHNP